MEATAVVSGAEKIGVLVGRNARRIREAQGMIQLDVSMHSGDGVRIARLTPQQVSAIETGTIGNPGTEVLTRLARGLRVSVDELLKKDETTENTESTEG